MAIDPSVYVTEKHRSMHVFVAGMQQIVENTCPKFVTLSTFQEFCERFGQCVGKHKPFVYTRSVARTVALTRETLQENNGNSEKKRSL
jgi:hypothetical protein